MTRTAWTAQPRANARWTLTKMTPENLGEVTVTREAEIEREPTQICLAFLQPGERLLHSDAQ